MSLESGFGGNLGSFWKVDEGAHVASGSFPTAEPGFSSPMQFGGSILTAGKALEHDGGSSNKLADAGKLAQVFNLPFIFLVDKIRIWCLISTYICIWFLGSY